MNTGDKGAATAAPSRPETENNMTDDLVYTANTGGGTLALSWGRYGGFYACRWRVCLGWAAITYLPVEVEDLMRAYVETGS